MGRYFAILVATACTVLAACAPSVYTQAQKRARAGDYAEAQKLYYNAIQAHPDHADAWRELGVAFFDQGDDARATEALEQAARIQPDARTHLYLGMVAEREGDTDMALRAYGNALRLHPGGETHDLLEARVRDLVHVRMRRQVAQALANEHALETAAIPESTVAVVAFAGDDLPPDLQPLTKGLAEFTALDLAKVHALRVVERLKIETLRKELALSQSELADPATAPRLGRLLGGRRIVTGALLGLGDDEVRIDGAVVNTVDSSVATPAPASGSLRKIFDVQKAFVFDVITAMGITLTAEERDAIAKVPTENYLAFLAYCHGLDDLDQGNLGPARDQFQKAAALDHGFTQAAVQGQTLSAVLSAGPRARGDIHQFSAAAAAASVADVAAGSLASFPAAVAGWNGFVPVGIDFTSFGQWVQAPPYVENQNLVGVTVRGNLDGQP